MPWSMNNAKTLLLENFHSEGEGPFELQLDQDLQKAYCWIAPFQGLGVYFPMQSRLRPKAHSRTLT